MTTNAPQLEHGSIRVHDVDDDLPALAANANEAYAGAKRHIGAACNQALEGGRALLAAKKKISHGEWERWLGDHFEGSARTARAWMRAANRAALVGDTKMAALPFSSLRTLITPEDSGSEQSRSKSNGVRPAAIAPRFDELKVAALQLGDEDRARLSYALAKSLPKDLVALIVRKLEENVLNSEPENDGDAS